MSVTGGGSKGGGSKQTGGSAETRQLAGMGSRFEQEARGVRTGALDQLAGILSGGVDWLGSSMAGGNTPGQPGSLTPGQAEQPRRYTRNDLTSMMQKYDPGKVQDIGRITQGLGEDFTLEDLRSLGNTGGLSGRSRQAWEGTLGELESTAKSGGSNLGGVSSGGGSMFLPIAQTAIEQSRQATARAVKGMGESFAGMQGGGVSNPFAMNAMAQARMQGDQATSQIPSRIIEQYMQNVLPLAFGQSPVASQSLSDAAKINAQTDIAGQQAGAERDKQNAKMMQAAASAIAAAAMMT